MQDSRPPDEHGQLDQAEEKAKRAQTMNVVPGVTSDVAESVLHDLASASCPAAEERQGGCRRGRRGNGTRPPLPWSLALRRADREADALLNQG